MATTGDVMMIDLRPATDADVREFVAWRYDAPYDAYDIAMDPDEAVTYFLGAEVRCHTLVDADEVVGFCTFGTDAQVPGGDYTGDALDIGLGVKPSRTGSGNGHQFVAAVVEHAKGTFGPRLFRVSIAAGNERALRVWSNAGFSEISRFDTNRELMGSTEFAILVREVSG
ncbi:MAG: GNAT family N-acetyltransferase [Acidimicrobiia bacterium]